MSFMDKFLDAAGEDAVVMGKSDKYVIRDWLDTGNYALNCLISADPYMGFPSGRTLQLCGPSSTGKTYLSLEIVKSAQRQGYGIVYIDTEFAQDKESLAERGLDLDTLIYVPVQTVEKARSRVLNIINKVKDEKLMIVIDSIGNLSTEKEVGDMEEGKDKRDMTRAQLLRGMFRAILVPAGMKNVPIIALNHVYAVIGSYVPMNIPGGGEGSLYGSTTIIELGKAKDRDEKDKKKVIGTIVRCTSVKNRMAKENQKIAIKINFREGLDRYSGLDALLETSPFIDKKGNRNMIPANTFVGKDIGLSEKWLRELVTNNYLEFTDKVMYESEKGETDLINYEESSYKVREVSYTKAQFFIPAVFEYLLAVGFADWLRKRFEYQSESEDLIESIEEELDELDEDEE